MDALLGLLVVLRDVLLVITPEDLLPGEVQAMLSILGAPLTADLRAVLNQFSPHQLRKRQVLSLLAVLRPVAERVEATPIAAGQWSVDDPAAQLA